MSDDMITQVRAKLALPEELDLKVNLKQISEWSPMKLLEEGVLYGTNEEHTRTAPIVEALIECAAALQWYANTGAESDRPIACEALRKLAEVSK